MRRIRGICGEALPDEVTEDMRFALLPRLIGNWHDGGGSFVGNRRVY